MKDFLSFAHERRSIRSFSSESVDLADIADCLLAASFAPSAGDLQPWEFVLVQDVELKNELVEACHEQSWMYQAPVVIAIVGDMVRAEMYHGESGQMWCRDSCCAATQNLLLAAHERELAACWVSSFDQDHVRELLGAPDRVEVVSLVALGHPGDVVDNKSVTPLDQVTFFESYGRTREDLSEDIKDFGVLLRDRIQNTRQQPSSPDVTDGDSSEKDSFFSRLFSKFRK